MEYTVTAYVNVCDNNWDGFDDRTSVVAEVATFRIKATDPMHALNSNYGGLFSIGNRMSCDLGGNTWPGDVRSFSVGDVARVHTPPCHAHPRGYVQWFSCDRYGWSQVDKPRHITELAGHERHTSR